MERTNVFYKIRAAYPALVGTKYEHSDIEVFFRPKDSIFYEGTMPDFEYTYQRNINDDAYGWYGEYMSIRTAYLNGLDEIVKLGRKMERAETRIKENSPMDKDVYNSSDAMEKRIALLDKIGAKEIQYNKMTREYEVIEKA
jgi:hypothetical protein